MNLAGDIFSQASGNPFTGPSNDEAFRRKFSFFVTVITATFFSASSIILWLTAIQVPIWQVILLASSNLCVAFTALYSLSLAAKRPVSWNIYTLAPIIGLNFLVHAALLDGQTVFLTVLTFFYGAIFSAGALSDHSRQNGFTLSLLTGMAVLITGTYTNFHRIRIQEMDIFLPIAVCAIFILAIGLSFTQTIHFNLRFKFLFASLAIATLPILVITVVNTRLVQSSIRNQNNQSLLQTAQQISSEVDDFYTSVLQTVTDQNQQHALVEYLSLSSAERIDSDSTEEVNQVFHSFVLPYQEYVLSLALIDLSGANIIDTNRDNIGTYENYVPYFDEVTTTGAVFSSEVVFDIGTNVGSIYIAGPIRDERLRSIGVFRIQYDAIVLQSILDTQTELYGTDLSALLLSEDLYRLADTQTPAALYRSLQPIDGETLIQLAQDHRLPVLSQTSIDYKRPDLVAALKTTTDEPSFSLAATESEDNTKESGVVVDLTSQPWRVAILQKQTVLQALSDQQNQSSILLTTIIASLVGVLASLLSDQMTRPILTLQKTAERITQGNLDAFADIRSGDELEVLANSFREMTGQLRNSIVGLETRVQARTRELTAQNETILFRSRQLQTISDVAREIVSVQDLDALLTQVVGLISERFKFYHVGIFLVDERREYAVLSAANSEGGQRMLLRNHRLAVGHTGIVGFVTSSGKPRIATDVGKDAVFFNNPDLPDTRSEMALPLIANNEIIGALDVQSTQADAFTQADIELFAILADQVSIAIFNDRLYAETVQTLHESERIHRQYLKQQWGAFTAEKNIFGFSASNHKILDILHEPLQAFDLDLFTDRTYAFVQTDGQANPALAIPIRVRGEVIGIISVEDQHADRIWQDEEISALAVISEQVGQTLENARLLEKTLERAEREKRVLEITAKIRSSSNAEEMINITLEELKRTLDVSSARIVLPQTHRKQNPTKILPPFELDSQE